MFIKNLAVYNFIIIYNQALTLKFNNQRIYKYSIDVQRSSQIHDEVYSNRT